MAQRKQFGRQVQAGCQDGASLIFTVHEGGGERTKRRGNEEIGREMREGEGRQLNK